MELGGQGVNDFAWQRLGGRSVRGWAGELEGDDEAEGPIQERRWDWVRRGPGGVDEGARRDIEKDEDGG